MKHVVLLSESHGLGSETFDFSHVCVICEGNRIVKRLFGGRLRFWLLSFWYPSREVYYGHSYAARDQMYADLAGGKVNAMQG